MLNKVIKKLKRQDEQAYIKRVMWLDLDHRIKESFNKYAQKKELTSVLGSLYLSKAIDDIDSKGIICSNFRNSTHIIIGTRFLGFNFLDTNTKKVTVATENNAQLWFSQLPSGRVFVFLAPYRSEVGNVSETDIIIGHYKEPASIGIADIENHLNTLFKYCVASSQNDSYSLPNYLYRKRLTIKDFRYRSEIRSKIIFILEKLIMVIFTVTAAVAGVLALD